MCIRDREQGEKDSEDEQQSDEQGEEDSDEEQEQNPEDGSEEEPEEESEEDAADSEEDPEEDPEEDGEQPKPGEEKIEETTMTQEEFQRLLEANRKHQERGEEIRRIRAIRGKIPAKKDW